MNGYASGFPADTAIRATRKDLKGKIKELREEVEDLVAENVSLRQELNETYLDAARYKADHEGACVLVAQMHEAATGRRGYGPIRGVVEDVEDVRVERDYWIETARTYAQNADYWREQLESAKGLGALITNLPPYNVEPTHTEPIAECCDECDKDHDWDFDGKYDYALYVSPNHPSLQPAFDTHNLTSQTYQFTAEL